MLKFMSRNLQHVKSTARASPPHNLCCLQTQPFSSSLKPIKNSPNQHSFTVNYLVNSCGFSQEKALSASKYVKFEAPDKPDSVLAFLKNYGFSETQISRIITMYHQLLLSDPSKTLLPKLEFLQSKGLSRTDVVRIISDSPYVLLRSLEKVIIPSFNFLSDLLQSEEKTLAAIKCNGGLTLSDYEAFTDNVEILREAGVPIANILYLMRKKNRSVIMTSSDSLGQVIKVVETMGFDPLSLSFVLAVHALRGMSKSTREKKIEVYKKWGWTDDEIVVAFKKHPYCMQASEDKITRVLDFFVSKMGWESSAVARCPILISLSLEKRIVPRCAVYQVLLSKGLIKTNSISLITFLRTTEKLFLKKFVNCHEEEVPELLKLYKEKLGLAK